MSNPFPLRAALAAAAATLMPLAALVSPASAAPPPLHVDGTVLKDPRGRVVRLQGVNIASMEWTATGEHVLESLDVATHDWHANIVRLPLAQDRWFGKTEGQTDGGKAYRDLVDQVVRRAAERNAYVLVDLHWSDMGQWGQHIGQHKMPDQNSALFWKDAAKRYAGRPNVLFDLYNEPRDVSWDVWKRGGTVTERAGRPRDAAAVPEVTYASPGMQGLLDAVRSTGARNVVVAGGLDWAYDLTGIVNGYALSDPKGNGVMYATHIYPWKTDWDGKVTVAMAQVPVFVGEVGCNTDPKNEDPATWAPKVLDYIRAHNLSWTAWDFHPSAGPSLIQDWTYAPTSYWGVPVKAALAGGGAGGSAAASAAQAR